MSRKDRRGEKAKKSRQLEIDETVIDLKKMPIEDLRDTLWGLAKTARKEQQERVAKLLKNKRGESK